MYGSYIRLIMYVLILVFRYILAMLYSYLKSFAGNFCWQYHIPKSEKPQKDGLCFSRYLHEFVGVYHHFHLKQHTEIDYNYKWRLLPRAKHTHRILKQALFGRPPTY